MKTCDIGRRGFQTRCSEPPFDTVTDWGEFAVCWMHTIQLRGAIVSSSRFSRTFWDIYLDVVNAENGWIVW